MGVDRGVGQSRPHPLLVAWVGRTPFDATLSAQRWTRTGPSGPHHGEVSVARSQPVGTRPCRPHRLGSVHLDVTNDRRRGQARPTRRRTPTRCERGRASSRRCPTVTPPADDPAVRRWDRLGLDHQRFPAACPLAPQALPATQEVGDPQHRDEPPRHAAACPTVRLIAQPRSYDTACRLTPQDRHGLSWPQEIRLATRPAHAGGLRTSITPGKRHEPLEGAWRERMLMTSTAVSAPCTARPARCQSRARCSSSPTASDGAVRPGMPARP